MLTAADFRPAVVEPLINISRVPEPRRVSCSIRPPGRCPPQPHCYCARACRILSALPTYRGRETGLLCVCSFASPALKINWYLDLESQDASKAHLLGYYPEINFATAVASYSIKRSTTGRRDQGSSLTMNRPLGNQSFPGIGPLAATSLVKPS